MLWLALFLAHAGGTIEGVIEVNGKDPDLRVAYIEGDGPPIPETPPERVIQQGKQFHPRALAIGKGSVVDFANDDIVFHHVFSRSAPNTFEIEEYGKGESREITFDEPGVVQVQCNKHAWMLTTILVLPNTWYAEADADGAFKIEDVKPGKHTLVLWSPKHRTERIPIEVPSDDAVEVTRTLKRKGGGIQQLGPDGLPVSIYSP